MKQKLTPWFPADVKPVHVGVYQATVCKKTMPEYYRFWNGNRFMAANISVNGAYYARHFETITHQKDIHWRGLAENPE